MDYLNWILGALTLASTFGAIAGTYYGVRQKTIIITYELSNKAYAERNRQLEDENDRLKRLHGVEIAQLRDRVKTLEQIKTPPFGALISLIKNNHAQVIETLEKGVT
jgi:hypothetical protein